MVAKYERSQGVAKLDLVILGQQIQGGPLVGLYNKYTQYRL